MFTAVQVPITRGARRSVAVIACVAVAFGTGLMLTAPAPASPCVPGVDHGHWHSTFHGGYVGGRWYNCGNVGDRVKIVVNNASDSSCYSVAAGTFRDISYDPTFWGLGDHTRSWARC